MLAGASKLIDSAVFLALFTAALYCIGLAEYSGALRYYGLSVSILDLDAYQMLYHGFLISISFFVYLLMILAAVYYLYAHAVLVAFISWIRDSYENKRKAVKLMIKFRNKRKKHPVLVAKIKESNRFAMLVFILVAFIFFLAHFEKKGSERAVAHLAVLKTNKLDEYIEIDLNGNKMTLGLLACGSRNCAAIDMKTKRIHYFPHGVFSSPFIEPKQSK